MTPKNTIDDLRSHLFETLQALKRDKDPMEINRAQAIANVANAIIESAKVEVAFLKTTGALKSTDFLPSEDEAARPRLPSAIVDADAAREREEVARLARINAAKPPARRINGEEFETVFDGKMSRAGASISSR